jgi:hypothetical protein
MTVWLLLARSALAAPEDVTLEGMLEHDGEKVVTWLGDDWTTLVRELGIVVANKPITPGETLGANGFELSATNTFAFISVEGEDGPTAWERATPDEDPGAYLFVPQLTMRKGLPMSFEIGATGGWVGLSRQGTFGGFARLGVVEGYKPWPDLSVQVGYSGYVANDELELGVMDLGVTLGSQFPFGSFPGINNAQFHPYVTFQSLRVSAAPVDEDVATALGIKAVGRGSDDADPALVLPQIGGGFVVVNGTVHFKLVGTWVPGSIATATVGMGFTY